MAQGRVPDGMRTRISYVIADLLKMKNTLIPKKARKWVICHMEKRSISVLFYIYICLMNYL